MKQVGFGTRAGLPTAGLPTKDDALVRDGRGVRPYPTPGEFVAQVGRILAFCFGLGLLAHLIVAAIGVQ